MKRFDDGKQDNGKLDFSAVDQESYQQLIQAPLSFRGSLK
jgi:hypothetical protein